MTRRKSPSKSSIDRPRSWEDVDRLVGLMAETERQIAAAQTEADERIHAVSEALAEDVAPRRQLLEEAGERIETFAIGRKGDFGTERSMGLAHGRVGWRLAPRAVKFLKPPEDLVAILEARGLQIAIVVTKRPSKDLLLTLPEKVLKELPVRVSQRDDFYVEYAVASASGAPPAT